MDTFDIPEPFNSEKFELFQKGISDSPSTDVYINEAKDFLFLYPLPQTDYDQYIPRVKKYSLTAYKEKLQVIQRRLDKLRHLFENKPRSLLEIGAGDGSFLQAIRHQYPAVHLTAVDKDQNTRSQRAANCDEDYRDLDELLKEEKKFQVICFFHVLEHVLAPAEFLSSIRTLMFPDSLLVIEVPSFFDPLLALYHNEAYARFYFQKQHPYVYSQPSLQRLLEHHGFQTIELIKYQRYGLENHLTWLCQGRPGGNEVLREAFKDVDAAYMAALERYGKADTVIWVGKVTESCSTGNVF